LVSVNNELLAHMSQEFPANLMRKLQMPELQEFMLMSH
jgi:hypothetical protein